MSNQMIKCNVESCKYNNQKNLCTLDNILVGTTSDLNKCSDKSGTECVNFEALNK